MAFKHIVNNDFPKLKVDFILFQKILLNKIIFMNMLSLGM